MNLFSNKSARARKNEATVRSPPTSGGSGLPHSETATAIGSTMDSNDTTTTADAENPFYYNVLPSGSSDGSEELMDKDEPDSQGFLTDTEAGASFDHTDDENDSGEQDDAEIVAAQQMSLLSQQDQQAMVVNGAVAATSESQRAGTPVAGNSSAQLPASYSIVPHPNQQEMLHNGQEDETIINSALAEAWFAKRREHRMQQQQMLLFNPGAWHAAQQQQQPPPSSNAVPMMDPRTGGFQRSPATQPPINHPYQIQQHLQMMHMPQGQQQQQQPIAGPNGTILLGPVDVDTGGAIDGANPSFRPPYSDFVPASNYDDSVTVVSKSNSLASYPSATTSEVTHVMGNLTYLPSQYTGSSYAASGSSVAAYYPSNHGGHGEQPLDEQGQPTDGSAPPKGFWSCCFSSEGDRNSCKGFLDIRTYHGKLAILLVTILVLAIATMAVSASMTFQNRKSNQSSSQTSAEAPPNTPGTAPVPTVAPTPLATLSPAVASSPPVSAPQTPTHLPTLPPVASPQTAAPTKLKVSTMAPAPQTNPPTDAPPSSAPSSEPTTPVPTVSPTTGKPSSSPSEPPSGLPSPSPSRFPSSSPTKHPTSFPTTSPVTTTPTSLPTAQPTQALENFNLEKATTIVGPAVGSDFGTSVTLSRNGQVLAVGAPEHGDEIRGDRIGQVRVLASTSGGGWREISVLDGVNPDDTFGGDVSLSEDGSILAVGASGGNGTVYTYVYNPAPGIDDYTPLGAPISGQGLGASFGHSVALSDDGFRLVVGAPYTATKNFVMNGQVRVYELNGNVWTQMGEILDGDASLDWLGSAVDISGDGNMAIASAPFSRLERGYVRTWFWNETHWNQVGADITNSIRPAFTGDRFGHSIALSSGDGRPRVAIGIPWKIVDGNYDAGMYLF